MVKTSWHKNIKNVWDFYSISGTWAIFAHFYRIKKLCNIQKAISTNWREQHRQLGCAVKWWWLSSWTEIIKQILLAAEAKDGEFNIVEVYTVEDSLRIPIDETYENKSILE